MDHPEIYTEDETSFFGWNEKLEKFTYLYKKKYFFNILSCRMENVIIKFLIYAYLFCGLMVSDCFGVVSKKGNLNSFVYDNLELN